MPAVPRVRAVGPEALEEVLADLVALEEVLFDDAWDAEALGDLVAGYGRHLHVADAPDGAVTGYVLTQTLGDFVDLLRIGVAPAARRGGVAGALLAAASSVALAEGAERVLLEVSEANTGARAFYDRLGFVEIDRRPGYYRDGSDALVLECALDAAATALHCTALPGAESAVAAHEPDTSGEGE